MPLDTCLLMGDPNVGSRFLDPERYGVPPGAERWVPFNP